MKNQPPRLASRLFEWYCENAVIEDLHGDMEELFYLNLEKMSERKAKLKYWQQVLSLLFSDAIKKRKKKSVYHPYSNTSINLAMIRNYLKVAFRNIYRYRYFSIVNVVGLAIGMSISLLLIGMYSYISSYDDFHTNKENIYRIISTRTEGLEENDYASAPTALADKLKEEYVGIKEIVRINKSLNSEVVLDKINIHLQGYYVDPTFLTVFNFQLAQGNASTVLSKPNSMVIIEKTAQKIFNSTDVIGKTIELTDGAIFEITGVLMNPPINSHFEFEALVSFSTLASSETTLKSITEQWTQYNNQYIYVLLPKNNDSEKLQASLDQISKASYPKQNVTATFHLQPLSDVKLGPDLRNSIGPNWDLSSFIIFGTIALLILLPACFNYTNISIARSLKRSKEIGLRKTLGGVKNQIFLQFITETILITLISLVGAIIIFFFIRAEFQTMLVESSALDLSLTAKTITLFLLFALFTGFFAGVFPALYFAGLNPIQALKSQSATRVLSGLRVRKVLTVFQFALSFGFIISLIVFSRQYKYSLNFDLGFQKENILDVELQGADPSTVKAEFSKIASVQSVSMSSGILGLSSSSTWVHSTDSNDSTEVNQFFADGQFIENTKLKFLSGKNFPDAEWKREQYVVVNEEFLKTQKITAPIDAIGKTFLIDGNELEVIGVLKNFNYTSLRSPIQSFLFRMDPSRFTYANLKVVAANGTIAEIEGAWNKLKNGKKFFARFFDDEVNEAYSFYKVLLKMVGFLGLLALSISLLGLLGMVVYTSETKTKEVSIRKVMGASTSSIIVLLSKDYFKLMLWAAAFALPVTTLLLDEFLSNMQYYHVTINFWDVLLSLIILLIMGLATVGSQTYKTALTNPAETLKCE